MEYPPARRRLNTYGKGQRKIWVHDLFDVGAPSLSQRPTTLKPAAPPRPIDQPTGISEVDHEGEVGVGDDYISIAETNVTKPASSTATSSPVSSPAEMSNLSMFDIQSSEDEAMQVKAKRPLKKRKVAPVESKPRTGFDTRRGWDETLVRGESNEQTAKARSKVSQIPSGSEGKRDILAKLSTSSLAREPSKLKKKASTTLKAPMDKLARRPPSGTSSPDGTAPLAKSRPKEFRLSSGSSANLSDGSNPSHLSRRSTPKRKRGVSDEPATNSPSPSDLHMMSLRLTPDKSSQQMNISSDEEMIDRISGAQTPRRGRKRLIDRLDGPRAHSEEKIGHSDGKSQASSSQPTSGTTSPRRTYGNAPSKTATSIDQPPPRIANIAPPGRQRATYARQRSHLSEMVDGLDSAQGSNSQSSSQQNFSQLGSFTSLASQMELDDEESDDPDAFTKIKSIHELRRGGEIRKFDLDLHTLLEDIESDSKPLRIQGQLQLINNLDDISFLRHFQDSSSFHRFAECAQEGLDMVSGTLMVLVFQHMISAEHSSPKTLLQILDALQRLPPGMVSDTRLLSQAAKDRSQNMSKLLLRDIVDFEEKRAKGLGRRPPPISLIVLRAIESTLRHLISLKEAFPRGPRRMLDEVLSTFTKVQEDNVEGPEMDDREEGVRLMLSLLEIACANHELAGSSLSTSRVSELGDSVSKVMMVARQGRPQMEHSCLRLIVSLSNNDPKVCKALADGRLVTTVFQVIDDHFLRLAGLAAREQDFDHAQLESVILAIGCLLNLAECADAARDKMLDVVPDGKRLIDRLVDIFNSHVDQTSEALTMDQTQILVAFGYISALLCTLCLNPSARERISEQIRGKGLSQLFGAADTFLDHLHTVEEALGEEGGSSTGFTARFTAVLESVKQLVE